MTVLIVPLGLSKNTAVVLSSNMSAAELPVVQSCVHFPVGAVRWSVVFGEGLELQRVKRVLSAADVLHGVFSSATLAEETKRGGA